jgi:ParB family chromosome partitioning protein
MNTSKNDNFEIEWHCLDLRYKHLRKHTRGAKSRLVLSICQNGLLVPVVVIPKEPKLWILIDGYLRVQACRELNWDAIQAMVWDLAEDEALIRFYSVNKNRPWDALEEASLLQELMARYDYSQEDLARKLGKSKSWVSYRIQLINQLPSFVQEAIYQDQVSTWTASRVIVPFARANQSHAKKLVDYLRNTNQSSRDIKKFYEHYMQSNQVVRQNMVEMPETFFKSLNVSKLQLSKEQLWKVKLKDITKELISLQGIFTEIFYRGECQADSLLQPFYRMRCSVDCLNKSIEEFTNDKTRNKRASEITTSSGQKSA